MNGDEPELVTGISVPYRVRFDECGPDGFARTSVLLRYAQDVAWIHSERLGFDRAWYAERGLAWVVRAAEVVVIGRIGVGQQLAVSTAVVGLRRVWARRHAELHLEDGSLAAHARIDWVIVDHRGAPTRVPPEFPALFRVPPATFEPGKVALPIAPPDAVRVRSAVRPQDLDPQGRVNNAAYVDYLEEAVLAGGLTGQASVAALPRTLRLEYLLPAGSGTSLVGAAWPEGGAGPDCHGARVPAWAWRLTDDYGRDVARGRLLRG